MIYSNLNLEQNKAVEHIDGPVLILAGAGTGKTATMTHRMAYMVSQGISPYNILAVTFTNKAAEEMRYRVSKLVDNADGMWIMTFHALCLRILRIHAELLGYKNGFSVYDETDKKSIIKKILKEFDVDTKEHPIGKFIESISYAKEKDIIPEKEVDSLTYRVFVEYNRVLKKNNAMDFDDLILNCVKLLEKHSDVLSHYANRFKYIMVDEYQDTNELQYKLIRLLSSKHGNLCVVGDDDQCIYEWRGADISNILNFERDFKNTFTIKLEQNYRSTSHILNLANSVIKNNASRKDKALWTAGKSGDKTFYKRLEDEKKEAWYVASKIEALHDAGYNYRDIAILYRKHVLARPFEEKLNFKRIPYRVLSGIKYYERKEIKDVLSYLSLIDNTDNNVAMRRVINVPKRGIGAKTMQMIETFAIENKTTIFEALKQEELISNLGNKSKIAIQEMTKMIDDVRTEIENLTLLDVYENILNRSGYLKALESDGSEDANIRIENLMEFKTILSDFEENEKKTSDDADESQSILSSFLERIALMSDIDNRDENEDAVVLMTLHAAKGLEFPVVFMPAMENMVFPGPMAFDNESVMEEERRLCYVGITRAMERLYLTSTEYRTLYGKSDSSVESPFLNEMKKEYLEGDKLILERKDEAFGLYGDDSYLGETIFAGSINGTKDGYANEPAANPFDVDDLEDAVDDEFNVGDTVIHPRFGEGMVIEKDGDEKVIVMYDSVGEKKMKTSFLKKKR